MSCFLFLSLCEDACFHFDCLLAAVTLEFPHRVKKKMFLFYSIKIWNEIEKILYFIKFIEVVLIIPPWKQAVKQINKSHK